MTHRCGLTKQVQKACPRMKRHYKISHPTGHAIFIGTFVSSLIALYLILILFLPRKVEILYYFIMIIGNMIDLLRYE